jgi:uncharacterized membrane protein
MVKYSLFEIKQRKIRYEILKGRFLNGEIDQDEYDKKAEELDREYMIRK